jgi:hypothetical protein
MGALIIPLIVVPSERQVLLLKVKHREDLDGGS